MSLHATAAALVEPGKGILAADESHPTMAKRLARVGLESNERTRKDYRELLLSTAGLS
jgi:fructose-bisphosphate aldolase class I